MNAKQTYNKFFRKYGAGVHTDPERFMITSNLCKGRVLDIGCGTGDLADFYSGEYTGIDVSDVAIKMAKEKERERTDFRVQDATKEWERQIAIYDTIVMAEFLEHIENDEVVFKNIRKVIKSDGRIIISVPNGDRVPDENHLRQFTIPELRKRFSQMGKVRFYNWPGANKRILMTIDLNQKNENLLSLVMIVKDEEWGLERAILSCIEFTDNIVISVDKATKDNTLKIAKLYADELKQHKWENNFSKARNFAKENVKTKWILSLDGHEYIKEYQDIDKALALDVEGLFVKVEMDAGDTFHTNRIFRSNLNWKHAIHNAIKTKTNKKFSKFVIKHDRAKGQSKKAVQERFKQRNEMMPRLLKKEFRKNKKSPRPLFYLARFYLTTRQFKKAIKYYKKYLKTGGSIGERWFVCFEASIAANILKKHLLALKFLRQAEKEVPNRWETAKYTGLTYLGFEQWKKALKYLVDSLKENTGDFSFNPEKKDPADIWDKIGFCFFQLGKYNRTKVALERSIELDKDEHRKKLNQKRIELIDRKIILK